MTFLTAHASVLSFKCEWGKNNAAIRLLICLKYTLNFTIKSLKHLLQLLMIADIDSFIAFLAHQTLRNTTLAESMLQKQKVYEQKPTSVTMSDAPSQA